MNRYALIKGEDVINVVESDVEISSELAGCDLVIDITGQKIGPGFKYIDGEFIPPYVPTPSTSGKRYSKTDFKTLFFTFQELVAIRTAAKSDPEVEVIEELFATAEYVTPSDPRTVFSLNVLYSKGLLTEQRLQDITNEVQVNQI